MLNFYFLVRFLAHRDYIVRNRISDFLLEHKINDETIPVMVIHAIQSFGISENLSLLRLLPYQDLTTEQLEFFLAQREKLKKVDSSEGMSVEGMSVLRQFDGILKKLLMSRSHSMIKPLIDELPPELLKVIYVKKWKQTIYRDLFKVYSSYPSEQILPQIYKFISENKRRTVKRSHLAELRIWSEVLYVNFSKVKDSQQKRIFFENTEKYFEGLVKRSSINPLVNVGTKKIYSLEICFHLLSSAWWLMDYLLKDILEIFTLDCHPLIYQEALDCLLEFDENDLLSAANDLLLSHKVNTHAFPYFLKLFLLSGDLEEKNFYAQSEAYLLEGLKQEKNHTHRIQISLALSDLFSPAFISEGSTLVKKSPLNFAIGNGKYGQYQSLLQERLLVHSLLTGEKVEVIDSFVNHYLEKKSGRENLNRLNLSVFFKKKKNNQ